jgi:excinuclease ABC subunit A
VLVIEHNLDVIKTADWIIDLGPEGGSAGGEIIAAGTPEQVAQVARSYTGQFVKPLLERARRLARTTNGSGGSGTRSSRRDRSAEASP